MKRPLIFVTGVLGFATLLAYGGRWVWFCELLVNFRTHLALLLALTCLLALATRHWRIGCVAALAVVLNAWPMSDAFFGKATAPPSDARPVRLVAFNINIGNSNLQSVADFLESLQPDIAVLAEVSPANVSRLEALLPRLPHRYFAEPGGVWGVVILSRWPLRAPQPARHGDVTFAARVDVDLGDRTMRLHGAHLNWPILPATEGVRNAQLAALGRAMSTCEHNCVAAGDFNVTPWSSHFRDVVRAPGVHDCAAGRGLHGTWPASLPAWMRIRIDHCLVSGAVGVAGMRVEHGPGSDHLATINDLLIGAG